MFSATSGTAWEAMPAKTTSSEDVLVVTGSAENTTALYKAVLTRSGLTEAEVARQLGITRGALAQMARRRKTTYLHSLARVAAVCGGYVAVHLPPGKRRG